MALKYQRAPRRGPLRQGEIVADLWEHRVLTSSPTETPQIASREHPPCVVLTADCDLAQDFFARFPARRIARAPRNLDYNLPRLVPYTILCGLIDADVIRQRFPD